MNTRILVVDDNESIQSDFRKILGASAAADGQLEDLESTLFGGATTPNREPQMRFELDHALQGQAGHEKVTGACKAGKPYALAFVDMRMPPGWDGVETIQKLWEVDRSLQVVICTAYSDYSWDEIVQKLGRTDQLLLLKKPFDAPEVWQLATALTEKWNVTSRAREKLSQTMVLTEKLRDINSQLQKEIGERMEAEASLRRYAFHDSLTDLPNRAYLMDRLEQSLARLRRDPQYQFAVLFLDLDNFKLVNDSLGHEHGDQLLVQTSQRIRGCLRSLDAVTRLDDNCAARIGGDEFVVVLDGIEHATNGARVAERILETLTPPFVLNGQEVTINASIGITLCDARYARADELLRDADTAMYRAKSMGKGRFAVFQQDMHQSARQRLELENEMRRAIQAEEFEVNYQPIVELGEHRIVAFEALLRWNRREKGWSVPDLFIPVAEESGLIVPLGMWVLRAVCGHLREWKNRLGACNVPINVNISRRQLLEPGLADGVKSALNEFGIKPDQLNLEITESGIINDFEKATRQLHSLKDLGVGLQMDDFGTGYSSLACLHRFPLDVVKIDRSFAAAIGENKNYAAIIEAIVSLAHTLGMKVTVEGIENRDQLQDVTGLGCDFAQGYLFAKPVPSEAVETLLLAGKVTPREPKGELQTA